MPTLQQRMEALSSLAPHELISSPEADAACAEFLAELNAGTVRAAEPQGDTWIVHLWVKQGILTLFRKGRLQDVSMKGYLPFFDKDTLPLKPLTLDHQVRIVPGGSAIRTGAYVAPGVICMPPMYINIGAYVDEGTMVDSHALVGTCAQIGKRVHLSAAAQIGGVLEPAGARPVVIEDDVMVGGNCGVYEGVRVRNRAVLGSGVILNASTPVYDLVHERILRSAEGLPLEIPEGAVVVAGTRRVTSDFGHEHGLGMSTPLIVKYRDSKTDARTALEEALRQ